LSDQVCLIALGGNVPQGDVSLAETVRAGAARLQMLSGGTLTLSSFYRTPCFPEGAGPDYVNAAARLIYNGNPATLLHLLHNVEAEFGRERVQRWGQRTLDLDLIAVEDQVLPDAATQTAWRDLPLDAQVECTPDQLILPHPRLQDRPFVLVPLAEIAPDWVHPLLNRSVREMHDSLSETARAEVVPL